MHKGERIHLRALETDDLNALYFWENDMAHWEVSEMRSPFSHEVLKQFIENGTGITEALQYRFVIAFNEDATALGCVDLFEYDAVNRRAGVGILIDAKHRENGFAKEALGLLEDYAKEVLHLHQLHCTILANNAGSIQLFEGQGYVKTGLKKEWQLGTKNQWHDQLSFQKLLNE